MVGWTITSRINCEIKFKIYSIIFLYSTKEQVIMTGTELLKVELTHNKGQDSTTLNWESNWQTKEGEIL